MRRYIDKVVAVAALILLLVLLVCQVSFMVSARKKYVQNMAQAKNLREMVDGSNPPDEPRDPALYSGKVFKAWEELPFAQRLTPWDLHPDQR